jgi:hypothetical protein
LTLGATTLSGTRISNRAFALSSASFASELAACESIGRALRGLGPVLLEVEHHLALPGGEAPGLAGGVLALLHLTLELHLILDAAQVALRLVERAGRFSAARFARGGEGRPAAGEHRNADGREFDDAVDMFEQVAVVAGDESRTAPFVDESEDGGPSRCVEIVGRLVEQENVGRFQPETGDRNARAFTAAEAADLAGKIAFGQVYFRERFGDAVFERPVGFGHVVGQSFAAGEAFQTRKTVCDAEGFGEGYRVIRPALGQLADTSGNVDDAGRWLSPPRDETEQRRFSRTVAAHEADAFGADGEREVFEEGAAFGRGNADLVE